MRVWLGGTFDPPHEGHIDFVRQIHRSYRPKRIYLVPNYQNPLKKTSRTSADHRLSMLEIAMRPLSNVPIIISTVEITSDKPCFTAFTLKKVFREIPKDLFLAMGSDTFLSLPRWKHPFWLARHVNFLVARRNSTPDPEMIKTLKTLRARAINTTPNGYSYEPDNHDLYILKKKMLPYSSTSIRNQLLRVPNQKPTGLTREVYQYLKENALYSVK